MSIAFQCPCCQSPIQVSDDEAGAKLRCPSCQRKVRVPAPVGPPRPSAKPEFLCPRCSTQMSARPEHAGVKQFCPRCGGKVRVPAPPSEPAAITTAEPLASAVEDLAPSLPTIASLVDDDELAGLPLPSLRRRRKNYLGWLIPVACLGLLAAVGSLLLKKPPVKFEGKIAGERLTDTELAPVRIDNSRLGRSRREAQD